MPAAGAGAVTVIVPVVAAHVVGDVAVARSVYKGGNIGGKTAISFQALAALESGPVVLLPVSKRDAA